MKLSSQKGFTLIELMIVICIIGIFGIITIPKFISYTERQSEIIASTQEVGNGAEVKKGRRNNNEVAQVAIKVLKKDLENLFTAETAKCEPYSTSNGHIGYLCKIYSLQLSTEKRFLFTSECRLYEKYGASNNSYVACGILSKIPLQ